MDERIEEYREWLEFNLDLEEDARYCFEKERPNAIAAGKAEYQARGFKKALKEFNRLFPPSAQTESVPSADPDVETTVGVRTKNDSSR